MLTKAERRAQLKQFYACLNTAEGKALMAELKMAWHDGSPLDSCPTTMGYNTGLSEGYKQLEVWQEGAGLRDEVITELDEMREATND